MLAVAYSGGKDSSYLLMLARDLGFPTIALAVDTGFMSATALQNIRTVPAQLGIRCIVDDKAKDQFRKIYQNIPADNPLDVCRRCHALIHERVRLLAERNDCDCIWNGMSPDEECLMPEGHTLRDMETLAGMELPLVRITYKASDILKALRNAGLKQDFSPLKTNCAINYLILDRAKRNPYSSMMSRFQRLACWIGKRSGYIAHKADLVNRRLQ